MRVVLPGFSHDEDIGLGSSDARLTLIAVSFYVQDNEYKQGRCPVPSSANFTKWPRKKLPRQHDYVSDHTFDQFCTTGLLNKFGHEGMNSSK